MTLSHSLPCNHPSLSYSTNLLYPLPDDSNHVYSYISENDFGPCNQIIVPAGYKLRKATEGKTD